MQTGKHGGLAGKARKNRCRNRAFQSYAKQWIAEYFEGEADRWHFKRAVPIRGRNEFFPSVAFASGVTEEVQRGTQRELRFTSPDAEAARPLDRRLVWPPQETTRRRHMGKESSPRSTAPAVIRFGATVKPVRVANPKRQDAGAQPGRKTLSPVPLGWSPRTRSAGRSSKLTLGGFAFGCAIGSAAAAMILLVLRVAFGG